MFGVRCARCVRVCTATAICAPVVASSASHPLARDRNGTAAARGTERRRVVTRYRVPNMHHYRSREDESSCATNGGGGGGGDPYFYLRLSAGSTSPYCGNQAAIKLEVDVKPELSELPHMTPVGPCGVQMQQQASPSEAAAVAMDAGVAVCSGEDEHRMRLQQHQQLLHQHDGAGGGGGTTAAGIGLLALTQLDGYGGGAYKTEYCDVPVDEEVQTLHQHHIPSTVDLLHRDKDEKYQFGRQLMYPSPDDIKHQVYTAFDSLIPSRGGHNVGGRVFVCTAAEWRFFAPPRI